MPRLVPASRMTRIITFVLAGAVASAGAVLRTADAKLPKLAAASVEKKKKKLQELILFHEGEDIADWGEDVVNPFKELAEEGKSKLAAGGIDTARLGKLKAVVLTGSSGRADDRDYINRDPDTILILGKDFMTRGSVFSLGPVLAVANADLQGDIYGADLVWFVEKAVPYGATAGLPVIIAPTVPQDRPRVIVDEFWQGDYGWKRPRDFLRPAALPVTHPRLDALWSRLDDRNAERCAQTVRRLVLHQRQFLPYLKERLRVPPRPTAERIGQLIEDLDSERYAARRAATEELERLGLFVEPELLFVLETRPSLEMRRRIEQILSGIWAEKRRIHRAMQALDELDPLGSRQLLEELVEGDPDLFITREAKTVLRHKEQKQGR